MSVNPATPESNANTGFSVLPSAIARDPSLTVTAKAVYWLLDDRQGNRPHVRVGLTVLAADLGISTASLKRALTDLAAAGLIEWKRTGRTSMYATANAARNRRVMAQNRPISDPRKVKSEPSDSSNLTYLQSNNSLGVKKQASNSGIDSPLAGNDAAAATAPASPEGSRGAASPGDGVDAFIEHFLKVCHVSLSRNGRVTAALALAMRNGWQPEALAAALRDKPRSVNAGTGVIVLDLESLAQDLYIAQQATTSASTSKVHLIDTARLDQWLRQGYGIAPQIGSELDRDLANEYEPECHSHGMGLWTCPACQYDRLSLVKAWIEQLIAKTGATVTALDVDSNQSGTSNDPYLRCVATYDLKGLTYQAQFHLATKATRGRCEAYLAVHGIAHEQVPEQWWQALGVADDACEQFVQGVEPGFTLSFECGYWMTPAQEYKHGIDERVQKLTVQLNAPAPDLWPDEVAVIHEAAPRLHSLIHSLVKASTNEPALA